MLSIFVSEGKRTIIRIGNGQGSCEAESLSIQETIEQFKEILNEYGYEIIKK
jgi:hypothetical protein